MSNHVKGMTSCRPPEDDCISRQAAEKRIEESLSRTFVDVSGLGKNILKDVPSAQPDLPEWAKKVEEYRASAPDTIYNPLAWALYQTWKEYDR